MTAEIIALPGVAVEPPPAAPHSQTEPNGCVVRNLTAALKEAEAGRLRSFVLVGELADGAIYEIMTTCEADLHVLDSALGLAQRSVQNDIISVRFGPDWDNAGEEPPA